MIALKNFNTFHKANVKKQIMGINIHTHLKHQKYHLPYLMSPQYLLITYQNMYQLTMNGITHLSYGFTGMNAKCFLTNSWNKPMLVTFLLGNPCIFHSYRMLLFLRSQIATIFCKRRQIEALAFFTRCFFD